MTSTCWFCERRPATDPTAYRATLFGNRKTPPDAPGRAVTLAFDSARIEVRVPRCWVCAQHQRRETAITVGGLGTGMLLAAGSYHYAVATGSAPFVWFGSTDATTIALGIIGFLVGLATGVVLSARVFNRTMARRSARNYPEVIELGKSGWSYDPPQTD